VVVVEAQAVTLLEQGVLEAAVLALLAELLQQVQQILAVVVEVLTVVQPLAVRVALELSSSVTLAPSVVLVALSPQAVDTQFTPSLHLAHLQPNLFKEQSTWHISQK
jgi:hypothetical protein